MGVKARSEKRATQKLRHLKDDMVKIVTEQLRKIKLDNYRI